MRAIIVVPSQQAGGQLLADRYLPSMLWLVDRPFVQHVCESLVSRGVKSVDWVGVSPGTKLHKFLGTGCRWGIDFRFSPASTSELAYRTVGKLYDECPVDENVVIGHADRLPASPPNWAEVSLENHPAILFGVSKPEQADESWKWSGWAVVQGRLGSCLTGISREAELFQRMASTVGCARYHHPALLDVRTSEDFHRSSLLAMKGGFGSPLTATSSNGTNISRSANIHKTARLIGEVHVGPGAEIGPGAVIGPHAIIGADSVIDRGAVISETVVLPGSYVGAQRSFHSSIVDRDRVVAMNYQGNVVLDNRQAVGDLGSTPLHRLQPILARGGSLASKFFGALSRTLNSTRQSTGSFIEQEKLAERQNAAVAVTAE